MAEKSKQDTPFIDTSLEPSSLSEAIAFIGAGAASLLSMWVNVREAFVQKLKRGPLKWLNDERSEKESAFGEMLVTDKVDKRVHDINVKVIRKESKEIWDSFVKKEELKSFWSKFKYINKFEKAKTLAIGLTVFSVGVGAFISLHPRDKKADNMLHVENAQQMLQQNAVSRQS
jgi:hypothetical protein